jgi:holliday junction DNA helicase RuvA
MIRHIRGVVSAQSPGRYIIDAGGLGYEVHVPLTSSITAQLGDTLFLSTYHAVREDSETLYGFATEAEYDMFVLLIDLPGIGPKSALGILSQADVQLLSEAAGRSDAAYLSKLSGIGKKSAEKIVAGLKDKVAQSVTSPTPHVDLDVIDALFALGYSNDEAVRALRDIPETVTDTKERIKEAIKRLGRA